MSKVRQRRLFVNKPMTSSSVSYIIFINKMSQPSPSQSYNNQQAITFSVTLNLRRIACPIGSDPESDPESDPIQAILSGFCSRTHEHSALAPPNGGQSRAFVCHCDLKIFHLAFIYCLSNGLYSFYSSINAGFGNIAQFIMETKQRDSKSLTLRIA